MLRSQNLPDIHGRRRPFYLIRSGFLMLLAAEVWVRMQLRDLCGILGDGGGQAAR